MLTTEQLVAAFNNVGWDTQAKVEANLALAGHQMKRAGMLIAIDGLAAEQSAANGTIAAKRQALETAIATETATISTIIAGL